MKKFTHYINVLIWTLVGLYLAVIILVNIPVAQSYIGSRVAEALSQKLATRVEVGRVNLGFFNRIIVDDILMLDQANRQMLRAGRVSAKFDYLSLLQGRISITSAQLFGLKANLYKATAQARPNFQFVLDSLASTDTTGHTPLHLELKSLIIRHGEVAYHQLDAPRKPAFDTRHLSVSHLSSHIILNLLTDDSLNINIKRLSLREASGIDLKSLRFKLEAGRQRATLSNLELSLPSSQLRLGPIAATYRLRDGQLQPSTLRFTGSIAESHITPHDLAALSAKLQRFVRPVAIASTFAGTDESIVLQSLHIAVPQQQQPVALASPADMRISLSGTAHALGRTPRWTADIAQLMVNEEGLEMLAHDIPDAIGRMHSIDYRGQASGQGSDITTKGVLRSGVGNANIAFELRRHHFAGHLDTQGINLRQLLDNTRFGILATNINVEGNTSHKRYKAKGSIQQFDYNDYAYHNLRVDGTYDNGLVSGSLDIDDPNLAADINGSLNTNARTTAAHLTANVHHFNPSTVNLLDGKLGRATYGARIVASFTGRSLNTAKGSLDITNFYKHTADGAYALDSLLLRAGNNAQGHYLTLSSDFAQAEVNGRFDYATLIQSVKNAIVHKLPSIQHLTPIKFSPTRANDFTLRATISRSDWLREFLGLDIDLRQPLRLRGSLSSATDNIEANIYAPELTYNGARYRDVSALITSPGNKLNADLSIVKVAGNGVGMEYRLEASATDDQLVSVLSVDNHAARRLTGRLNSAVRFSRGAMGQSVAHVAIAQSTFSVGDSIFTIHPSSIAYSKNRLEIDNFAMTRGQQHIKVNGITTADTADSLIVDLNDVDVSYMLDLVNFHAVDFSGRASGKAFVSQLFAKPNARAELQVDDFRFQDGRMGTLHARVNWNRALEEIDIDAQARDTIHTAGTMPRPRITNIEGYVSPRRNYIDLAIEAIDTRGEFVASFCSSFMRDADLTANGHVRLWGDLGDINLTGEIVANGQVRITPLNTVYTLHNDTVRCLVNEIQFRNDTILDRNGNVGIVSGSLYHDHLSRLTYDLNVRANHLLAYDWGPSYGSTFYGTVYGTGEVGIKGRSGEVNIDVDVTPTQGSQVVYDVSSPDAISSQEFIHWTSRDSLPATAHTPGQAAAPSDSTGQPLRMADIPTDIHINFLINTTPEATLKLIMDRTTGDYITLNGSGGIRAAYYNKGALDIFGNYVVDHGLYKLTIQNVIKKDFVFAQGSTIVFGGDPYAANLSLKAQYTVNSVSLSDLQIGRSFSGNNIRVNCIMNISGTPAAPRVDFDLDMPTVGTDAKQMIYSLINSEEEMNQQVLYLLAVGRFYAQGNNNATADGSSDSQTSLAMQSILSGQLSQQINTVLRSVVKNNDWNFGANISTGDEGWNNAEYEGLLSGRMLNNRLLFDGQFGYRDNDNATTSFIGDFDLKYLIVPSGNLSVHVYNQTNDRYFTRNSLNTQGLGFIIKKDFDTWRSLFRLRKKKPTTDKQLHP